jgi:hypothetical protein
MIDERRLRELEAKWRRGGYCDYSECADELAAVLDTEGDRQEAEHERDASRREAGQALKGQSVADQPRQVAERDPPTPPQEKFEIGLSTGRWYLHLGKVVVAMEADPCRWMGITDSVFTYRSLEQLRDALNAKLALPDPPVQP